jgi:hypothetical protein
MVGDRRVFLGGKVGKVSMTFGEEYALRAGGRTVPSMAAGRRTEHA